MAGITITIHHKKGILYAPDRFVRQGDTVTFKVVNIPSTVEVVFESGVSCFNEHGPYRIDGSSLWNSTLELTVAPMTSSGEYRFSVVINDGASLQLDASAMDSKKGGIDVTTDPPDTGRYGG
jgi:hypothetical protein